MAGNPDKFVLISTGGMLPPDTVDFSPLAKNRMVALVDEWKEAIRKKKPPFTLPATVRFVQFNFDSSTVLMYDHVFLDKGTKNGSLKPPWTAVPIADTINGGGAIDVSLHDNNLDTKPKTKTLSITNVYNTARHCTAESVLEISIFSHAFVKGPVLLNTSDANPPTGNRDPKDMDGRTKDFKDNMGEAAAGSTALDKFIKNFDKNGQFRVYGCNVQDVVRNVHIVANVAAGGAVRASKVVTITTTTAHGLLKGEEGATSGVADASFNTTFTITDVPSPTTFKFAQDAANATSGGGIVSISIGVFGEIAPAPKGAVRASNVVTIMTTTKHDLEIDTQVRIREVSDSSFNGPVKIIAVPSDFTFRFAQSAPDAKSGGGMVSISPGTNYKRNAAFQVIDQAFRVPFIGKPLTARGAKLRRGDAPTSDVVLDMWGEVMNEAERDVKAQARDEARAHGMAFTDAMGNAAWAATPAKRRNKLANELLMMHRQLDLDFYPAPNTTDPTAAPAQKTVTKSWAAILALCAKKMTEGYVFKAAEKLTKGSKIVCHGAVPGVGGNNARDLRQDALMRVCVDARFGCESGFGEWIEFYRNFFFRDATGKPVKNSLDERNYARFDEDMVKLVKKLLGP